MNTNLITNVPFLLPDASGRQPDALVAGREPWR
jgi:hypothetical protein